MEKRELLESLHMDFEVTKKPLFINHETMILQDDGSLGTQSEEESTKWFATYNERDEAPLGVVGNQYNVTQNKDIINVLYDVAEKQGFEIVHGAPIKNGERCFVQLKLDKPVNIGNDELSRYVIATWGHDGKHGVRIGFGNKVLSCQNQFYQFYKKSQFKMRHTSSIEDQLKEIPNIIAANNEQEQLTYDKFAKWNSVEIFTDRKLMNFKDSLWKDLSGIDKAISYDDWRDHYSSRKINNALELNRAINMEMHAHGQTLWGLFNGVTYYTNHLKSVPSRQFGRDESIIFGGGSSMNQKAFDKIDEIAKDLAIY